MSSWELIKQKKNIPKLKNPILIEGLPGIGNVGKIAADFIIDELRAKKFYDFFSYELPNSVFVNEQNLVDLPTISLYYKKHSKHDLLILGGDVQPIDEQSSYAFSDFVLETIKKLGCKEVITLGGIGLPQVPKKPRVYCTGNSREMIKAYAKNTDINDKLYGIVGPIMGVSGLLLGLSKRKNMKAVSLLAETYGHPMYLGVKGAREIVKVLNKVLDLRINLKQLNKEILEIESMVRKTRIMKPREEIPFKEASYIG